MDNQWYVVKVKGGSEKQVYGKLSDDGLKAAVPSEDRIIRRGGNWTHEEYILFPGYVFIQCEYTPELYYRVKDNGVQYWLGYDGKPKALSGTECEWIRLLTNNGVPLGASTVRQENDGAYRIVSGILRLFRSRIIKVDRHARRATIEITLHGEIKKVKLSCDIESTETEENESAEADGD